MYPYDYPGLSSSLGMSGLPPLSQDDGEEWIESGACEYCGSKGGEMHKDHIYPRILGGSVLDDDDNLVRACSDCNYSKSKKLIRDWRYPFDNLPEKLPRFLRGPHAWWHRIDDAGAPVDERVIINRFERDRTTNAISLIVRRDTGLVARVTRDEITPFDTARLDALWHRFHRAEIYTCVASLAHAAVLMNETRQRMQRIAPSELAPLQEQFESVLTAQMNLIETVWGGSPWEVQK